MGMNIPDPNDPKPTPDNPNPEPARPPSPPETPQPSEPPGVPSPSPDPIPSPNEPIQIPPGSPPEVPTEPSFPGPTAFWAGAALAGARKALLAAALACLATAAAPAAAQSPDGAAEEETPPADPCHVEPDGQENTTPNGPERNRLSPEELARCNGVLSPPKTGDQEIEAPPPDTGTTPVIPPGAVPEQPPE